MIKAGCQNMMSSGQDRKSVNLAKHVLFDIVDLSFLKISATMFLVEL